MLPVIKKPTEFSLQHRIEGYRDRDGKEKTRFIPAHAGKPGKSICLTPRPRVYPRAYGETQVASCSRIRFSGLSPRIRGNRLRRLFFCFHFGSIPAHTGKPFAAFVFLFSFRVYPRAYGETLRRRPIDDWHRGLSPRIRGNQSHGALRERAGRSIPAHTGKPLLLIRIKPPSEVYPRAYGETLYDRAGIGIVLGLSPRIRGNLIARLGRNQSRGSIPAHTGKPARGDGVHHLVRVYPRAYGETGYEAGARGIESGLSPRIRGNLIVAPTNARGRGSIPAHTGKPAN